jgi:hypothetical protein
MVKIRIKTIEFDKKMTQKTDIDIFGNAAPWLFLLKMKDI